MHRKTWLMLGMGAIVAVGVAQGVRHCRRMMSRLAGPGARIDLDRCGPTAACCSDQQPEETTPLAA